MNLAGDPQVTAAIWLRVSTDEQRQSTDNQVPEVQALVKHRGYEHAATYTVDDSAWKNGGGPAYRKMLAAMLQDAHQGKFSVLVVWALDRITRNGAEDALRLIRQLRERGCTLVSVQESWLSGNPEIADVLVSFAGWMAQQESARKSERIRAGLARRRAEGKPVGRQPGAKDRKPRKRSGYVARYERPAIQASRAPDPAERGRA